MATNQEKYEDRMEAKAERKARAEKKKPRRVLVRNPKTGKMEARDE